MTYRGAVGGRSDRHRDRGRRGRRGCLRRALSEAKRSISAAIRARSATRRGSSICSFRERRRCTTRSATTRWPTPHRGDPDPSLGRFRLRSRSLRHLLRVGGVDGRCPDLRPVCDAHLSVRRSIWSPMRRHPGIAVDSGILEGSCPRWQTRTMSTPLLSRPAAGDTSAHASHPVRQYDLHSRVHHAARHGHGHSRRHQWSHVDRAVQAKNSKEAYSRQIAEIRYMPARTGTYFVRVTAGSVPYGSNFAYRLRILGDGALGSPGLLGCCRVSPRFGHLRAGRSGYRSGYPDGTFRPGDPVSRQQFAKMIVKTLG